MGSSRGLAWAVAFSSLGVCALLVSDSASGSGKGGGLIPLPLPEGTVAADAWAVNDSGVIVGVASLGPRCASEDDFDCEFPVPVRWGRDGVEILSDDTCDGIAVGVSASGQVAGDLFCPYGRRAAVWDDASGTWEELPRPLGGSSAARGINDDGVVVGGTAGHAAVWSNGEATLLPRPAGVLGCTGNAINNAGAVAGQCLVSQSPPRSVPVVWEDGVPTVLDDDGGGSFARHLNERGDVVGFSADPPPDSTGAPAAWDRGDRPTGRLLAWPGAANGVSARGDVVGYIGVNGGTSVAALWPSGASEARTWAPLDGGESAWFRAISNSGWMVGFSQDGPGGPNVAVKARR